MKAERLRQRVQSSRPLVLLVVGIIVMAGVAFEAYRAVRSQHAIVDEVLRDYTAFATWSLEEHVRDELEATFWEMLQPVNHGDALHTSPQIPPASELAHYLPWDSAACYCHRSRHSPTAFLGFTIGADTMGVAPNLHAGPGVRVVPVPAELSEFAAFEADLDAVRRFGEAERAELVGRLTEHARTRYRRSARVAMLTHSTPAGRSLVGYTLMPTTWGDTLLYGAELGPAALQRLFDGVIDGEELLPDAFTRGRSSRGVLVAQVTDPAGEVIYRSDPAVALADAGTESLPRAFGRLTVHAAIRPEVAGSLIIGGLPRSRLPFLLGIFALACGLAIAGAVQVRRTGELARMRSRFVASVSHELRTPLTQIRMYLQTVRLGRYATDEQRDWLLENADRESSRLAGLVENVLEFAGRGGASRSPAPAVDVAAEIRRAAAAYEPLAASRRATVALDLEHDVWARITPDELRQVLFNLLDNATKYGPTGQTVTLRCGGGDDGAGTVRVEVSDEGAGVAVEERERIWDPFYRVDAAGTRAVGGSGIGLSVVREIVERAGGRVGVDDARGGGARFTVILPRGAASAPGPDANTDEPAPSARTGSGTVGPSERAAPTGTDP